MKFDQELKRIVNQAIAQGVPPTSIIGTLELVKSEYVVKILAAVEDRKNGILPARIVPPLGGNGS